MEAKPKTVDEYIKLIPEDKKDAFIKLRNTLIKYLPKGFSEEISYGMIGYVVPFSTYPAGYHCDSKLPLPFVSIACQKNFIAVYHMGIYADEKLLNWFTELYSKNVKGKLDMGKSCMRFKKPEEIPFDLIGELMSKMTPAAWISLYENKFRKK